MIVTFVDIGGILLTIPVYIFISKSNWAVVVMLVC